MRLLKVLPRVLFGLMFAGGGLFFLSQTSIPMWRDWHAMQSWQPVQARLLSVSVQKNATSARYRYAVDGANFESDRVYVASFSDNIGPYHARLHAMLKRQLRSGEPVQAWVDPYHPARAVIDRDMRWGLFALISGFCSVFIFIGLAVMFAGGGKAGTRVGTERISLTKLRRDWNQARTDPNFETGFLDYVRQRAQVQAPVNKAGNMDWHLRKGWGSATIRSDARRNLIVFWGFAIFLNAISWPLLFVLPEEVQKSNYPALIGLLFPLMGLYLIYRALRVTQEYRRFGIVTFEMDPYPGAIGGHVGGQVHVAQLDYATATAAASRLLVRLECVYSYVSGSGKNRSRSERIKWAQEGVPRIEHAGRGVALSFRFDLPGDLPEADVKQTDAYHYWRLSVKADIAGIDLDRQFNIPVFSTGETSSTAHHDISAQVGAREQEASDAVRQAIAQGRFDLPGLSRAMRISVYGGEVKMYFPMFRNKVLTMFCAIFTGAFGFGSYMMIKQALEGGLFGLFVLLFSLPFVVVATLAGAAMVYFTLNNLRVHIVRNKVSVLRRLFLLPVYYRQLSVTDISHLSIKCWGSTGQGVNKVGHFKILAHDRNGKKVTLADDIDGEAVAGHFRDYLAQRMNVRANA